MDVVIARTFLAAADTGSFVAAARKVNASPPTVTERIKQLEHLLGARLFERNRNGCQLTTAGRRLIEPTQALVRAWEQGLAKVALPARFEQVVRIGGQHALWPPLLIPWLKQLKDDLPEIAFRASAAAPAQLNRAIAEGELDIVFLYDPVLRKGIRSEEIASDRLVLVTANPSVGWQDNFARIDWGETANAQLAARLGDLPAPGLELDLGILSLAWLVETNSSGFVPERLAKPYFAAGSLTPVAAAPSVEFSPFVCWRATLDPDLAAQLVSRAKHGMGIPGDQNGSFQQI